MRNIFYIPMNFKLHRLPDKNSILRIYPYFVFYMNSEHTNNNFCFLFQNHIIAPHKYLLLKCFWSVFCTYIHKSWFERLDIVSIYTTERDRNTNKFTWQTFSLPIKTSTMARKRCFFLCLRYSNTFVFEFLWVNVEYWDLSNIHSMIFGYLNEFWMKYTSDLPFFPRHSLKRLCWCFAPWPSAFLPPPPRCSKSLSVPHRRHMQIKMITLWNASMKKKMLGFPVNVTHSYEFQATHLNRV